MAYNPIPIPSGPNGLHGAPGPTGPIGHVGMRGATGPQGAVGMTGTTGPGGGYTEKVLLSVPIIGHADYKLELVSGRFWNDELLSYSIRVTGPKPKDWYQNYVVYVGVMNKQRQSIDFNLKTELEIEMLKTRTEAEKLCITTLMGKVIRPGDDDMVVPPVASDVMYDPFWKTFIEDAMAMVVVTDVLLV